MKLIKHMRNRSNLRRAYVGSVTHKHSEDTPETATGIIILAIPGTVENV